MHDGDGDGVVCESRAPQPLRTGNGVTSPELIAILAVGATLAGIVVAGQRAARVDTIDLRNEIAGVRDEVANLREPMASLVPLLEGLREVIHGRRDAP